MNVKELSAYLKVKPSTLYAWAAREMIPHYKVHGLLRFRKDEIDSWVASFRLERDKLPLPSFKRKDHRDIDFLIARVKQSVYNTPKRKTRLGHKARKEGD